MSPEEIDARLRLGQPVFCTTLVVSIERDDESICGWQAMVFPVEDPSGWNIMCRRCGILTAAEVSLEIPKGSPFYVP